MMDFTNHDASEPGETASAWVAPAAIPSANEDARIDSIEVARLSGLKRRTVTSGPLPVNRFRPSSTPATVPTH